MIFKTITDDFGKPKLSINNSLNRDFFKQHSVLSDSDINALKAYNAELEKVIGYEVTDGKVKPIQTSAQTAFNRTMQDASIEAQNMAASANGMIVNLEQIPKVSKAATVGLKAISIAGNILLYIGISKVISGIAKGIDHFVNREKYAQQALEEMAQKASEAKSNIDSLTSKMRDNAKTVNNIKDRYAELAQGVDQFTGKNLNLSNDDYARFHFSLRKLKHIVLMKMLFELEYIYRNVSVSFISENM